jgi:hypothetical protein
MDHLMLTVSWALLQDHADRLEDTLVEAEYSLMHRPPAEGSPEDDQLALPLHHGGFRFRSMTAQVAVAAQLSAVALMQVAMRQGLSEFRPFDSPKRTVTTRS